MESAMDSRSFDGVHRLVSDLDQRFDFGAVFREYAEADAGFERNAAIFELKWLPDVFSDPIGGGQGAGPFLDVGEDHAEFVSAEARNRVGMPGKFAHARSDFAERRIAGAMAKLIIDRLQAVHIDVEDGKRVGLAARQAGTLAQAGAEQSPGGQSRPGGVRCLGG